MIWEIIFFLRLNPIIPVTKVPSQFHTAKEDFKQYMFHTNHPSPPIDEAIIEAGMGELCTRKNIVDRNDSSGVFGDIQEGGYSN